MNWLTERQEVRAATVARRRSLARSDGRLVRYYEAERDGGVTACDSRSTAFDVLRGGN